MEFENSHVSSAGMKANSQVVAAVAGEDPPDEGDEAAGRGERCLRLLFEFRISVRRVT